MNQDEHDYHLEQQRQAWEVELDKAESPYDKNGITYKEKLIALLESLECQNIESLIEDPIDHIKEIGCVITKYAKAGAIMYPPEK
jgi:hypothetical protein